jgi:hypothetical protein
MPARRRRDENLAKPRAKSRSQPTDHAEAKPVEILDPDPDWHPIALQLWNAILSSGQAVFYEQSDLAYAYFLVEQASGHFLGQLDVALRGLMLTEGHRRQLRVQLDAPEDAPDTSRWEYAKAKMRQRRGETLTPEELELIERFDKKAS